MNDLFFWENFLSFSIVWTTYDVLGTVVSVFTYKERAHTLDTLSF